MDAVRPERTDVDRILELKLELLVGGSGLEAEEEATGLPVANRLD